MSYEFNLSFAKILECLGQRHGMWDIHAEESLISCMKIALGLLWNDEAWMVDEDGNGNPWIKVEVMDINRAMTFKLKYGDLIVD